MAFSFTRPVTWLPGRIGGTKVTAERLNEMQDGVLSQVGVELGEVAAKTDANGAAIAAAAPVIPDSVLEYPWSSPRGTYVPERNTTYIPGISATGRIIAAGVNHATNTRVRADLGQAIVDDHCMPALYVRAGRRSLAAWTRHNADNIIRFTCSAIDTAAAWKPVMQYTTGSDNVVSYTQLVRLTAASNAATDVFLLFTRHRVGTNAFTWRVRRVSVDQASGTITPEPGVILLDGGSDQIYFTTGTGTNASGHQIVRLYISYNPQASNSSRHHLLYLEVNAITGDVTDDAGTVLGNTGLGTGTAASLPVVASTLTPVPGAGTGLIWRNFAGRSGLLPPAFACASWSTSNYVATAKHIVRRQPANPGMTVSAPTSGATMPYVSGMSTTTPSIRVVMDPATLTPAATATIIRWYDSATNNRGAQLRVLPSGVMELQVSSTGTTGTVTTYTSAAIPAGTNGFGFDLTATTVKFFTTTDRGATWPQLGSTQTFSSHTIFAANAPLQVGYGSSAFAGAYRSVTFSSAPGGAVVASQDFIGGGWTSGQTAGATDPDPQGNTWTLVGDARIDIPGWATFEMGDAGVIIGGSQEGMYLAGAAYPEGSVDDQVILARHDGTRSTVKRVYPEQGLTGETLLDEPGVWGRPATTNGPVTTWVSEFTRYAAFTDYAGNTRALGGT